MKLLVSFGILFCVGFTFSHDNENSVSGHQNNYVISNREDYYTIDGFTYFISWPFKTDWFGANEYCRYRGMHLVDIPTYVEHYRLLILINQLNSTIYTDKQFWTSGTDLGREGQFVWMSSGHPFTFANWFTGQPDNAFTADRKENENCVTFSPSLWMDNLCSVKRPFICRNKLINPILLGPSPECS